MRMSKATKTIAKRGTAFLLSTLLCIGCISTNWFGAAPGSSDGITAQMSAYAAGTPPYEANKTYYDAGTFDLTGSGDNANWNINNAVSVLTGTDAVTLAATTDVNTSASDTMTGQGFGDANKNLSDYMAPTPNSESYQYIAKGTTVEEGDSIKISWEIKSWPSGNANATTFPTTSEAIGNLWGTDGSAEYDKHAPEWASGNKDYFKFSADGDYNTYNGTGQKSEFRYGSNFLVWDNGGGTGGTSWNGQAWSVVDTYPVQWGVDSWKDGTTGNVTPDQHTAAVRTHKGLGVWVNGDTGTLGSDASVHSVAGYASPGNMYAVGGSGNGNDFIGYLNANKHIDVANNITTWTLPAYDVAGLIYSMYGDSNKGAISFLKDAMVDGVSVTKGVPGTTGFNTSSVTLNFDDTNVGLRIYGIQSAVFAVPGQIWYGLQDEGQGGLAYRNQDTCKSDGFDPDANAYETGKFRYPAIQNAAGAYLESDDYVHAYTADGRASEFVWVIDQNDLGSGWNQSVGNVPAGIGGTNGIRTLADMLSSDSPFHKTRLYTQYDGDGYRTNSTNLDGDAGEQTLVNSHVPMQVRSILYYDVTDDSMRATGTASGSRTPDKVFLDITNTVASDKDGNLTAHDNTVIRDVLTYTGLVDGKTYTLNGKVCALNADDSIGTQVATIGPWTMTASNVATSNEQDVAGNATIGVDGSIRVSFPGFNSASGDYGQKKYVVVQTLTDVADNTNTDTHGDATTASQIVTYNYPKPGTPVITTVASSGTTPGAKFINPVVDDSIVDEVTWSGLEPGSYYLEGQLYDTANNATVNNSTAVRSNQFTVASVNDTGKITMSFPLTADMLAVMGGRQITVGQFLYKADGTKVLDHIDMNDTAQTVKVQEPGIVTDLVSATMGADGSVQVGTEKSGAPAATTVIADKIQYSGLVPGANYKCATKIVYQDTGNTLKSSDGKESVFYHTFQAKGETASFAMGLKLLNMQNDLYGKKVVAYNELYWVNNGKEVLIKQEQDLKNERQTFTFTDAPVEVLNPSIDTLAEGQTKDGGYSRTTLMNAEKAVLRDTVTYRDLTPGTSYTLTGTLYLESTGKVITGVAPVSQTFTPADKNGSVVMQFTLDTRSLGEQKVVVGESLSITGGDFVLEHFDLKDDDQTLTVAKPDATVEPDKDPYIDTEAQNSRGGKTLEVSKEAKIFDTVFYYNLKPGRTYKLEGEVREHKTGDRTGQVVTQEFTPEKESGSIEMQFTVDTTKLGNQDLVVYETLLFGTETVAFHRDLEDDDQTVHVNTPPNDVEDASLSTVATDSRTGSHTLAVGKDAGIKEVVEYDGLIKGREYTLTTTVIDKQTGQQVVGGMNKKFKAEETDGTLTILIPIDTTNLAGHTLVVCETLYYDKDIICSHEDINDLNQTVYVGKISTVLTGKNGAKTVPVANSTGLQDSIAFEGLTPGRNYTITGYIIDVTGVAEQPSQQSQSSGQTQQQTTAPVPTATVQPQGNTGNGDQSEESLNVNGSGTGTVQPTQNPDSMGEPIIIDEGRRQAGAQSIKLADGTQLSFNGELVATGTASFTPSAAAGTVNIDFSVSTKGRNGHNLVCVEVITDNGVPVAVHADLADAQQTVSVRTAVNIQTGASPFGKVMTLISVLMMLGFGIYTAQAIINRKKFEE